MVSLQNRMNENFDWMYGQIITKLKEAKKKDDARGTKKDVDNPYFSLLHAYVNLNDYEKAKDSTKIKQMETVIKDNLQRLFAFREKWVEDNYEAIRVAVNKEVLK